MASKRGNGYIEAGDEKKLDILSDSTNKHTGIDWLALREEWILTNISMKDLAKKYEAEGVTNNKVLKHYYKDKWADHLAEYKDYIEHEVYKIRRRKAAYLAARVIALDEKVMTVSEKVVDIINAEVDKLHPLSLSEEKIDIELFKNTVSSLAQASRAVKDCHYNIRLACDKVTGMINEDKVNSESNTEEEDERIENEFGFITITKGKNEFKEEK
jgi:hypothetical protein